MSSSTTDLVAIVTATSRLLEATDLLLDAQGLYDPTWLPLTQATSFCEAFCQFHPTMTVTTLVGGLDVCTAALLARAEWENLQ